MNLAYKRGTRDAERVLSKSHWKVALELSSRKNHLILIPVVKNGTSVIDSSASKGLFPLLEKRWYREHKLHSSFSDEWSFFICGTKGQEEKCLLLRQDCKLVTQGSLMTETDAVR